MKHKVHYWSLRLGLLLVVIGLICFGVRVFNPGYVDASGLLHEPFYLVGFGYAGLFGGVVSLLVALVTRHQA